MIRDILFDYTLRNVLLGSAVLGIVSGMLGSFAVLRQRSLLGDTMSHAALPGIAVAFLVTGSKSPLVLLIGAAIAGWLGTWVILLVTGKTAVREDGAQGIILSVFFGFGLVLLSHIQRLPSAAKAGLDKFLFGQAATLMTEDVIVMSVVGTLVLIVLVLFWKEFKILSFDPDYTDSQGFPSRVLEYFITFLIVASVVIGLQTVGVVLMSAMVVTPAASARQWTNRLEGMVILSGIFGAAAGITGGLISSMVPHLPTGPTIVIVLGLIAFVSVMLAPERGLVAQIHRRAQNRRTYAADRVLMGIWKMSGNHEDYRHPFALEVLRGLNPEKPRSVDGAVDALKVRGLLVKDSQGRYSLNEEARNYLSELQGGVI